MLTKPERLDTLGQYIALLLKQKLCKKLTVKPTSLKRENWSRKLYLAPICVKLQISMIDTQVK